jgi:hypothetical protein
MCSIRVICTARRPEAGETLAELLVAIAILGVAVVAIVGGLANGILASSVHRQHATADTKVRSTAECLRDRSVVYRDDANYSACSTPGVTIAAAWWNGDNPSTFSNAQNPNGLERLTVTASSGRTSETVMVLKGKLT